jgi:hypothetical protein
MDATMDATDPTDVTPLPELASQPGCVNAVPAIATETGFRLLTMRAFQTPPDPPAFAWIDQRLFRTPERQTRHGLFFGVAFRPEIMDWLIKNVGRPSEHADGKARRNPNWPALRWRSEERRWEDETLTTEWFVDVEFTDDAGRRAFLDAWSDRLSGRYNG